LRYYSTVVNQSISIYESPRIWVIVTRLEVIKAGLRIVVVTTVAERVESADGVCGGILKLHELAPSIVGVGYDEFAGGGISESYYIALEVVDVIIEVVAAVRHGDTVALLVVEEAQCLAVGPLGKNLRAVEQVLGRSRAYGFTCANVLGIVGEGKFFILFQPL